MCLTAPDTHTTDTHTPDTHSVHTYTTDTHTPDTHTPDVTAGMTRREFSGFAPVNTVSIDFNVGTCAIRSVSLTAGGTRFCLYIR